MSFPRFSYHAIDGHEIHLTEWGERDAPVVVMWHGLARHGRDFDRLAAYLAPEYRVLCPDTIGRGLSSWSADPRRDYLIPVYRDHADKLLDLLGLDTVRWVGTSMGGILGMLMAGIPKATSRITHLVLNDVGPVLSQDSVDKLKAFAAIVPEYPTLARYEAFLRLAYAPFGPLTEAEWRAMVDMSVRRRDNGKFSAHYDPAVMQVFAELGSAVDLWDIYNAISCPTLVVRGAVSELLPQSVAEAMTRSGPRARLEVVAGCGHAPMLNTPEQMAMVGEFLR